MSQVLLSDIEQQAALVRLGYSEREASFLRRVALHGGYFLRRQYCEFLDKRVGGTAAALIEKVIDRGHGRVTTYANNTQVYHLSARPFYATLGQEDNRNRRERQPITIKTKLMCLDYVLAHSHQQFLPTEQEKIAFFERQLGIDRDLLPIKRYVSRGLFTDRFFVEKYPIALQPETNPSLPPVVSFCFVDPGLSGSDAFATFLEKYQRLFNQLRRFEVVYVAETEHPFAGAAKQFTKNWCADQPSTGREAKANPLVLNAHFEARQRAERQEWGSFDRAKLSRLREDLHRFSGAIFDRLYDRWQRLGIAALDEIATDAARQDPQNHSTFLAYKLAHSYAFLGHFYSHR
jgi:hypothetical protein